MTPRHRSLPLSLTIGLAATLLAACAPRTPAPPPAPPTPRTLRIEALRRQSQSQQDRDKADCQSEASGGATSSATWAGIFTDCMTARGYSVR